MMLNIKNRSLSFMPRLGSSMLIISIVALVMGLVGCRSDDRNSDPKKRVGRTVISYMVADNNLQPALERNINMMEAAWNDQIDGRMLVFIYPKMDNGVFKGVPTLMQIVPDSDMKTIRSTVVKTYDRQDPCDPAVMRRVLGDAMSFSVSDSYALIFASHALGWLPTDFYSSYGKVAPSVFGELGGAFADPSTDPFAVPNAVGEAQWEPGIRPLPGMPLTRTFGSTYSYRESEMEIYDLAHSALPTGVVFDYIMFDACLMSCVEVAYELRNNCQYLLASSAEVLSEGFPYHQMVPQLFGPLTNLSLACKTYFDYYNNQPDPLMRSATISLVDSKALAPLAETVRAITATTPSGRVVGTKDIYCFTGNFYNLVFFDLGDFIHKQWGKIADPALISNFDQALSQAVVFGAATEKFMGRTVDAHCGLTSFVSWAMGVSPASPVVDVYRNRYSWSRDSGLGDVSTI